jgi:membrane-bound serine protease (ClpP class)
MAVLIVFIVIVVAALAFAIQRVVKVHRKQATTGREELLGKKAIAHTALTPEGQVFFRGERWEAVSESGNIEANEKVTISKVDGLTLHVKKLENKEEVKTTKTN